ncbi:unnamed protein product [Aureobasidium uvarum]|uniref:P-loop containing nucleoside triphosphate hydrolase protein n=1 Tax=Aureobasidium uvarum TaxID=2773716 RepID=A0A9N8PSV8_9PEZI|nr:unnamed protein product [Aureobasidium uvarum]
MRIAAETSDLDAWPDLNHKTKSKAQPPVKDCTQSLMTQVFAQRRHVVIEQWILTITRTILTFGSPYCVLRLIARLESNDRDLAWVWLCGIALSATSETIVHYRQNWFQWSELETLEVCVWSVLHDIKLQANEDLWRQRVKKYREIELRAKRQDLVAQNISFVWKIASPLLVSEITIFVHAYLEGQLRASVIFTIRELLPQLEGTLGLAPLVIQDYLSAQASSRRLQSFLRIPDRDDYIQNNYSGNIVLSNASFTWPDSGDSSLLGGQDASTRFNLEHVNWQESDACCNSWEAKLLDGSIETSRGTADNPIALVTQTPWLQSTTLKDNMLLGEIYDASRYERVIEVCALIPDLEALKDGDQTSIGAQGVMASGGQRARIALARALYSRARILLLDDILSALDTRVARHIVDALNGPLGDGRTRILVTHQLELCMSKASCVVHIAHGTAQAVAQDPRDDRRKPSLDIRSTDWKPVAHRAVSDTGKTLGSFVHEEDRQVPVSSAADLTLKSSPAPCQSYIEGLGGYNYVSVYIIALVLRQVLVMLPTWTLKNAKMLDSLAISQPPMRIEILHHTGSFVASAVLAVSAEYLFYAHQASGTLRASEAFFNTMLDTVVQMPLSWIDSVSTGELTQRFCTDSQAMDDRLMPLVSEFLQCGMEIMTTIVIGLNQSWYTGFIVFGGLCASSGVGRLYNRARVTVQRADRQPTSRLLGLAMTTTTGLSTIRAFGATSAFEEQMHSCVDDLSKARRHFWIANRWLGLQMSLIGIIFSFGTGVVLLHSRSAATDASLFGFALSFSMRFSSVIFKAVDGFGAFETSAVAASAISEFKYLKSEAQDGLQVTQDWPRKGGVEVKNLSVRYSDSSRLVLDNINFTVAPGERIGMVGRTGAGKSTLLLALLRMIEAEKGSVYINGLDVSTIRLRDLRQRIGYIPQNPALFSGTVRTNLDPFDQYPDAKLEKVLQRVAHRLTTVATFDKIIVMDDGKIVEQGPPKYLLAKSGAFHGLVKSS